MEILVLVQLVARGCSRMKKLFLGVLTLLLLFGFGAGFIKVEAQDVTQTAETQQTAETVSVTVTTYFDSENQTVNNINDQNYGTKLSVDGSVDTSDPDYAFAYWIVNGVIYQDYAIDHQFTLTKNMDLTAVFHPTNPLQYAVLFMDTNGDNLDTQYVSSGGSATPPSSGLPDKPGYIIDSENTWSVDTSNITGNTVSVLQYVINTSNTYTLSVVNGTVNSLSSDTFTFNDIATVVADTPAGGEYFDHWEIDNRTVSYQSTYSFSIFEDNTITAVYNTDGTPSDEPFVTLSDDLGLRSGESKNSYLGQFYLPSGYEFVEVGVLSSGNTEFLDLSSASATRNSVETYNGTTDEFIISLDTASATSVRAYLICKDSLGDLVTVYDQPAYNLYNGGFETGDLTGWDAYQIWKNESGMIAYSDARVTDGTYFMNGDNDHPYGRDGSYNLGIVDGSTYTWDQTTERMGHLRSSNFILGGSGWISFKLGAGKVSSTAYVSVRRTTDNVEIARFGNEHYNDTSLASSQYGSSISNAEAYMFQYYFDLSSVGTIGESYYFTLTDASSWDWNILSADSFVTYYKTAPTPGTNETATNIVPSILGAGSATNAIVNGYFDSGLTGWQNPDNSWYINSGQARSNEHGDSDMGVLRSSAFTVNGTGQYLRFDWAGGQKYDKQIFVSIKEVGTNIEVLRYVRRDNLSSKESESFDNHMLDLSSLDPTKEYYLEFVDNRSGSWGISYVDAIRLVDEAEWNSVTSGDRAVSVTPLEVDFVYVKQ